MEDDTIFRKIIYWFFFTFFIITLFILIGLFAAYIFGKNLNFNSYIGLWFGLCGAIIAIFGLYKPVSLITPIIRKKPLDIKASKAALSIWLTAFGFSILLGGVIYSFTGKFEILLLFLILPVLLVNLLGFIIKIFLKNHKN